MITWSYVFYFSFTCAAFMLGLLGLGFAVILPGVERFSKRFFLVYFIVLMACCFVSLIDVTLYAQPVPETVIYFVLVLECLLISVPLPMMTLYLLHCCRENMRNSRLLHAVLGLWMVFFILLVSARYTGVFYYAASDNYYYRGSLYPLLVLPLVMIQILNLAGMIRYRKRISPKIRYSFLIAILPMTAVLLVQMFIDVFPLLDISIVLSALAMYGLILSEQIKEDLRHQREIANQRAKIMVLEMRPHFIYNTLTSVYCLCNQDPKLARRVIMDFTTYLRRNFTAIASETPVPFSSELEHTRAYLAVEKAQYEDSLFVDYDTPHTRFRVPPLTLQLLVENAIKHGRDPYAGAFHISIRTKKTDAGSEIIVADDGRGFDPDETKEYGIALNNIRQRLKIMCGGSLEISAGNGGGTVVTVTIPDSSEKQKRV